MFPVVPPGGVDPGLARRLEPAGISANNGVLPLAALEAHAPRAPALPVGPLEAQATRVQAEPPAVPELPAARRMPGPAELASVAGPALNRAAWVAPQLQLLLQWLHQLGMAEDAAGPLPMVRWPPAGQPLGSTPAEALQHLRDTLGRSPLFAANPRTPAVLAALAAAPWGAAAAAGGEGAGPPGAPLGPAANLATVPDAGLASQASTSAPAAAAANTTVEHTQQALQLLLHGRLQWEGQLTPGVPARLERQDAWLEDPRQPGSLQRGSLLRVEIDLPETGRLVVLAQQVGTNFSVSLLPGERHAARFEAALADLRQALAPLADPPVELALQARRGAPL